MSQDTTAGGPEKATPMETEESQEEKEKRLRELALASMRRKAEVPQTPTPTASKMISTTGSTDSEAEILARRRERFAVENERAKVEKGQEQTNKLTYLIPFTKVQKTVYVTGSWADHYNDDTTANSNFKRLVGTKRLDDFIIQIVQTASNTCLTFSPGNTDYPGQLATFRLELWTHFNDQRFNGMTIAGGVYADRIDVFHAGPGS